MRSHTFEYRKGKISLFVSLVTLQVTRDARAAKLNRNQRKAEVVDPSKETLRSLCARGHLAYFVMLGRTQTAWHGDRRMALKNGVHPAAKECSPLHATRVGPGVARGTPVHSTIERTGPSKVKQ